MIYQLRVGGGSQAVADAFHTQNAERAPDRIRACRLAGMGSEAQAGAAGIGEDFAEEFRGSLPFIAPDAEPHNTPVPQGSRKLRHRQRRIGSKLPDSVKNPLGADSGLNSGPLVPCLDAFKATPQVLLLPKDHARRDNDFRV